MISNCRPHLYKTRSRPHVYKTCSLMFSCCMIFVTVVSMKIVLLCNITPHNCKWWPTRCNYFGLFIYSESAVHVFRRCLCPPSGTLDCIYSIWYCPPVFLLAGVMDEMELQFHLIHDMINSQNSCILLVIIYNHNKILYAYTGLSQAGSTGHTILSQT